MDYECVNNHYKLIAVDLTRQKELYVDPKASWQIEFLWQLSKLNPNGITTDIAADQNMFVLTIFKKNQGNVDKIFSRKHTSLTKDDKLWRRKI